MYSYEFDCVISGTDAMWAQGWPGTLPEGFAEFSDSQLKYFAGGGFSLPCAALVQYTYWLNPHGTWWKVAKDSDDSSESDSTMFA